MYLKRKTALYTYLIKKKGDELKMGLFFAGVFVGVMFTWVTLFGIGCFMAKGDDEK